MFWVDLVLAPDVSLLLDSPLLFFSFLGIKAANNYAGKALLGTAY